MSTKHRPNCVVYLFCFFHEFATYCLPGFNLEISEWHKKQIYRMSDEKRKRSPNWQLPERELLLELVEEHYNIVECRKLDGASLKRKHAEWELISRKYNSRTPSTQRTGKDLRSQWGVLRKIAKRDERMRQETGEGPHTKNPLHDRIVHLIQTKLNEVIHSSFDNDDLTLPAMQDDDSEDDSLPSCSKESKDQKFKISSFDSKEEVKGWDCNAADDSDEEHQKPKSVSVFSPRDCRLLLHCVRQEKNVLFSSSPLVRKQKAWVRIARAFNRQSPTKRAPPELKKKFQNLKTMASRVNNAKKIFSLDKRSKYEELSDDGLAQKIKSEPKSDATDDFDMDNDDDDDDDGVVEARGISNGITHSSNHDPLSNGVSGDSVERGLLSHAENKEVDKLKMELLNYELETAKLQRKRIEDTIEAEKAERDLQALETSLRIRAARLEVLAAESKITPLHPALVYTAEEMRAQQYLSYRTT